MNGPEARNKLVVLASICLISIALTYTLCLEALRGLHQDTAVHDVLLVAIGILGGLLTDVSTRKTQQTAVSETTVQT